MSQVLQSMTSFIITLAFSNILSPSGFGHVAIYWLVWMLLLSLNRAVFGEQLLADRGQKRSEGYGPFMVAEIGLFGLISIVTLIVQSNLQLLPGVLYIIGFVASDATRYWYISKRANDRGDSVVSIVRLELLRLLSAAGLLWICLIFPTLWWLGFIALVPGYTWLVKSLPLLFKMRWRSANLYLKSRRRFEIIMLLQFLLVSSVAQLLPLFAAVVFGSVLFGGIRLTQSLISPVMLLSTAFQPSLISHMARYGLRRQLSLLMRMIVVAAFAGGLLSIVCVHLVRLLSEFVLPGGQSEIVNTLILPAAVGVGASVIGQPGGALIRVLRLGGVSLAGQVIGVSLSVLFVLLSMGQSVTHFMWALALGNLSTVIATYALLALSLILRSRGGKHAGYRRIRRNVAKNQRPRSDFRV